jgi:hypothetical protein
MEPWTVSADAAREGGVQMKETVAVLMRFLRHDPVGQRFGVAVLVLTWLAVAWMSLAFAVLVLLTLGLAEWVRRRREQTTYAVDDLDDLY